MVLRFFICDAAADNVKIQEKKYIPSINTNLNFPTTALLIIFPQGHHSFEINERIHDAGHGGLKMEKYYVSETKN